MDYGKILKKAWQSIWKNKILWVFAILAGQLSIQSLLQTLLNPVETMPISRVNSFQQLLDTAIWNYSQNQEGILLWLFLAMLMLLGLIRYCLTIIGATGLVRGIVWERQSKEIRFSPLFKHSLKFFWRYLGFVLLTFVVVIISMIPLLLGKTSWVALFFCLFCGVLLVIFFLSFWIGQAIFMMLIEDLKIVEALSRSWEIAILTHFGKFVAMFLIVFGISLGIGIVIALPSILVNLMSVGTTLFSESTSISTIADPLMRVFLLFIELLSAFVTALATLFVNAAWVHFYLDLKEADMESELPLPEETPSLQLEYPTEEEE